MHRLSPDMHIHHQITSPYQPQTLNWPSLPPAIIKMVTIIKNFTRSAGAGLLCSLEHSPHLTTAENSFSHHHHMTVANIKAITMMVAIIKAIITMMVANLKRVSRCPGSLQPKRSMWCAVPISARGSNLSPSSSSWSPPPTPTPLPPPTPPPPASMLLFWSDYNHPVI